MKNYLNRLLDKYSTVIAALVIGHIVFLSILGCRALGWLQPLELKIYDFLRWQQSHSKAFTDDRIVMILADDEDQRQWGWPLSDQHLVQLLTTILAHKPNAIGLDLYRDLPVPIEGSGGYEQLKHLFANSPQILGIFKYQDRYGVRVDPSPVLKEKNQLGFNDVPTDTNGIIRRDLLYMYDEKQDQVIESLALRLALHYLAQHHIVPQPDPNDSSALRLGKTVLSPLTPDFGGYVNLDAGGFQFMLDYFGTWQPSPILNFTKILTGQLAPAQLQDKIVIIGVNAQATADFVYAPFKISHFGEQRIPGAMIHAYATSQLLRMALGNSPTLQTWSENQEMAWIGLWSLLSALLCLYAQSLWRLSLILIVGFIFLFIIDYGLFAHHVWIIVAAPALSWISSALLMLAYLTQQGKQQRAVLMQIFSRHVSKKVAEEIWKQRDQYLTAGRLVSQRLTATVLFTDLQNFTTVSEQMEPHALMEWLNQYMATMVNIIENQYHGQVNKFIGDGIMAVFGVPIPRTSQKAIAHDAINAVNCAVTMRREMSRLTEQWQAQGLPLIRMRVGIFTGPVIVGSLGSVERQEYAVLGDTVNTASRLESFDKNIEPDNLCRIIIGESTLKLIRKHSFKTEQVGEVNLKGKQARITLYRVRT
ncbi:transmembrane sensor domain-containing protein [Thioploca ingrica]|uniref:Transmembrane sensor domain-containing protein n=1 Tax=Thioploca ingrica TaxID=40754 RepID=A0A090AMU9_9GAMM|nr:transmembrane sensor domain-containing protein [Thioploca ingrica]